MNQKKRMEKVVNFEKTKITKPYYNKKILSLSKNNRKMVICRRCDFQNLNILFFGIRNIYLPP